MLNQPLSKQVEASWDNIAEETGRLDGTGKQPEDLTVHGLVDQGLPKEKSPEEAVMEAA